LWHFTLLILLYYIGEVGVNFHNVSAVSSCCSG
jgi:hypothetical protein